MLGSDQFQVFQIRGLIRIRDSVRVTVKVRVSGWDNDSIVSSGVFLKQVLWLRLDSKFSVRLVHKPELVRLRLRFSVVWLGLATTSTRGP